MDQWPIGSKCARDGWTVRERQSVVFYREPHMFNSSITLIAKTLRIPTFPNRHQNGLQAGRAGANTRQLFELAGRDGEERLLGAGASRVDLQHTCGDNNTTLTLNTLGPDR